ncbi:putative conserved secreted protein [Synechococcus sp. A18-25c]|uniref:hypothetical protein n=1 Tax=Synechococcus sp. A18-25c TaxID=1866938 RepID=UPI001648B356|nr:hypothetical protein [Synechococcus sp. A18-25c]QNJ19950.1 putative conserved secreted protein [Synechococcus sp. A18-25c]
MTRLLLLMLTVSMSAVGISAAYTNEDVPQIGALLPATTDAQESSIVFRGFYGVSGWRAGSTRLEASSLAIGRNPYGSYSSSGRYGGSSGYGSYGGFSSGGGWSGK